MTDFGFPETVPKCHQECHEGNILSFVCCNMMALVSVCIFVSGIVSYNTIHAILESCGPSGHGDYNETLQYDTHHLPDMASKTAIKNVHEVI